MSTIQKRNEKVFVAGSFSCSSCGRKWRHQMMLCRDWMWLKVHLQQVAICWGLFFKAGNFLSFYFGKNFHQPCKTIKSDHILEYASFLSRLEPLVCGLSNLSVIVQLYIVVITNQPSSNSYC